MGSRVSSGLLIVSFLFGAVGSVFSLPHTAHAATFANLSHGSDVTDASSYTFSSVGIGTPSASRIVVVGFSWRDTAANAMVSASIGGISMTKLVEQQHDDTGNGSYTNNSIWVARVPSGTSADIALTLSDVAIRAAYVVGTLEGGSLVPYDTATATGIATLNSTIDVPENGTIFALAGVGHTTYTSAAWTGATEFADTSFEASAYSAATYDNATLETNRSVNAQFTLTGGVDGVLVAASFLPSTAVGRPPNNLGLVGYWSFNEATSTTATDFSGNRYAAQLTGFPSVSTPTSGWISGKRSTALAFDGSDDKVDAGDIYNSMTLPLTVSAWIYRTASPAVNERIVISESSTGGGQFYAGFNMYIETDNQIAIEYGDNTACGATGRRTKSSSSSVTNDGRWYHVVGVMRGATDMDVYINGVDAGGAYSGSAAGSMTTLSRNFLIGNALNCDGGARHFNGRIDEVRVYNRALTSSEVAALYGATRGSAGAVRAGVSSKALTDGTTLESGLVGHWTFDGSDFVNTVADASNSGLTGYVFSVATTSIKGKGKLGQGARIDGTGHIRVASFTPPDPQGSVSMWVKVDNPTIENRFFGAHADFEIMIFSTTQKISSDIGGSSGPDGTTNIQPNTWYHVVATYDESLNQGILYLNGAQEATGAATLIPAGPLTLNLGRSTSGTNLVGQIDDVRVYNRVLTAAEAKQLYTLGQATISQ